MADTDKDTQPKSQADKNQLKASEELAKIDQETHEEDAPSEYIVLHDGVGMFVKGDVLPASFCDSDSLNRLIANGAIEAHEEKKSKTRGTK